MNFFKSYIYLIFFIKIVFILTSIMQLYLNLKGKKTSELDKKIVYLKEKFEFIFVFLMSLLLIYLFNPLTNNINIIDKETKTLLFLFGLILLITANWETFITESLLFKRIQNIVGKK